MIVKRINRYLNKGTTSFSEERGTPAVSRKAILLLSYGWNSCPVLMDIIANPLLFKKENLQKLHYVYRGPIRLGLIAIKT